MELSAEQRATILSDLKHELRHDTVMLSQRIKTEVDNVLRQRGLRDQEGNLLIDQGELNGLLGDIYEWFNNGKRDANS